MSCWVVDGCWDLLKDAFFMKLLGFVRDISSLVFGLFHVFLVVPLFLSKWSVPIPCWGVAGFSW